MKKKKKKKDLNHFHYCRVSLCYCHNKKMTKAKKDRAIHRDQNCKESDDSDHLSGIHVAEMDS